MQHMFRWTVFTLMVAGAAIGVFVMLHVLARHYGGLESPATLFAALIFFSIATSIAAIAFASKLENEAEERRARKLRRAAERGRPTKPGGDLTAER